MIRPNFSGQWQANLDRSRLRGQVAIIAMTITHGDEDLRQEIVITRPNGAQERQLVTFPVTGGEATTELRGAPLTIRVRWNGPELIVESTYVGNVFRDYWSLSSDGRTLTMEHRDDGMAGQATVLDRVDSVSTA